MAPAMVEQLGEGGEAAAQDVMLFLRHALHSFPDLAPTIYEVHINYYYAYRDKNVHIVYTPYIHNINR